jgi:hypothetical protein
MLRPAAASAGNYFVMHVTLMKSDIGPRVRERRAIAFPRDANYSRKSGDFSRFLGVADARTASFFDMDKASQVARLRPIRRPDSSRAAELIHAIPPQRFRCHEHRAGQFGRCRTTCRQ